MSKNITDKGDMGTADKHNYESLKNPWNKISLSDYEAHMSFASVMQLQSVNAIMKVQFEAYPVSTVMILGVAGGNGIEHINNKKYQKVYGVDINANYLNEAYKRHGDCNGIISYLHKDLSTDFGELPHAELLIANLILEYVGYAAFRNVITQVRPIYTSCVIQTNVKSDKWVSYSPYAAVFNALTQIYHEIDEKDLTMNMQEIKYQLKQKVEYPLPNGKKLLKLDYTYTSTI